MKIVVYKDCLSGRRGADKAVCTFVRLMQAICREITLVFNEAETEFIDTHIPSTVKRLQIKRPRKTWWMKLGFDRALFDYSKALNALIENEKPDVIISTGTNELLDLAGRSSCPQAPILQELHVEPAAVFKRTRKKRNRALRRAFEKVRLCRVLCEHQIKELEELMPFLSGKVVAIANSSEMFGNVADIESSQGAYEEPFILYPAAFTREKNHRLLIEAFAQVAARFPAWQLHLYGEGKTKAEMRALAGRLNLSGRILFKDFAPALGRVYRQCEFLAVPSVSEGFGLVVIEAALAKKPAVALQETKALASLIENEVSGLVTSSESFAAALSRLMASQSLRCALGERAFVKAQAFAPGAIQEKWAAALQSARIN